MQAMFRHWSQAVFHRAKWLPEELKGPKRKRAQNRPYSRLIRPRTEEARQIVSDEEDSKIVSSDPSEEAPNIDSAGDALKTEEAM